MKEIIIVFVILAFSLYGFYASFKNAVMKVLQISMEIRKEKNILKGGENDT